MFQRLFQMHFIIVDLVRELLVDIFVIQESRSAEHHAQILVQSVNAPEYPFA